MRAQAQAPREQEDHGRRAPDEAEQREERAQRLRAQQAQRLAQALERAHAALRVVALDRAVADPDVAQRARADDRIVRDDHDRGALGVDAFEQPEDLAAVRAVEVSGGLVREQQRRPVDQRTRDRRALPLAARHLARAMRRAVVERHARQRSERPLVTRRARDAAVQERQRHVLEQRHARQQVERLEHEADRLAAQLRQPVRIDLVDRHPVQPVPPRARPRQTPEDLEQRRLPRARRPHHADVLPPPDLEIEPPQRMHLVLPDRIRLVHIGEANGDERSLDAASAPRGGPGARRSRSQAQAALREGSTCQPHPRPSHEAQACARPDPTAQSSSQHHLVALGEPLGDLHTVPSTIPMRTSRGTNAPSPFFAST